MGTITWNKFPMNANKIEVLWLKIEAQIQMLFGAVN